MPSKTASSVSKKSFKEGAVKHTGAPHIFVEELFGLSWTTYLDKCLLTVFYLQVRTIDSQHQYVFNNDNSHQHQLAPTLFFCPLDFNTFGGNPVSCAAGLAVLAVLESEELAQNAEKVGKLLQKGLRQVFVSDRFLLL